jgi:hypothetical protein
VFNALIITRPSIAIHPQIPSPEVKKAFAESSRKIVIIFQERFGVSRKAGKPQADLEMTFALRARDDGHGVH